MRRVLFFLALLALFAASPLLADEIHWTVSGPGAVTFDWRGPDRTLRYGVTSAYGRTAAGRTPSPLPLSSPGPFWEARLDGLEPGAVYHYSIAGGPDHVFRPAPAPGGAFTVYVEGDVGDAVTYPRVAAVQSLIADGRPDFVLVVGDLAYADDNGIAAIDRHFDDVMVWSEDAAYMPAWGNHDGDNLADYKGRFDLPHPQTSPGAPASGCCGEDWSWFDYGGVRFVGYPEPYTGAWEDWAPRTAALMDEAQADSSIRFIVTFGHRPAYSSGHHPGSETLAGMLGALGAAHSKYVLNLNGHSHDYERTFPQSGVVHVTVGIGGSSLEQESGSCPWLGACPPPTWSAFRALHHGALRLRFEEASIAGEAICGPPGDAGTNLNDIHCAPGDVFDSFRIGADAPPVVLAPASKSAPPAEPLRVVVRARDPDGDPIDTLTADFSRLPTDAHASFVTGRGDTTGILAWQPAAADTGDFVVVFRAANTLADTAATLLHILNVPAPPPVRATFALLGARPNPARQALAVSYSLADDAPAWLELVDLSGRIVARRDLGAPGAGAHTSTLARAAGLRSGLYWLRLLQAARVETMKVILLP